MQANKPKATPKWLHWLSRIGTTFGLLIGIWFYLQWTNLLGGVLILGLLCALTQLEVTGFQMPNNSRVLRWIVSLVGLFIPLSFHFTLLSGRINPIFFVIFEGFLVLYFIVTILSIIQPRVLSAVAKSKWFPIWGISLPMSAYVFVAHFFMNSGRNSTEALAWTIALVLLTKITDIGALIVGSLIGKHKLAPETSPGKTIEGAIGGIVVSGAVGLLIYYFAGLQLDVSIATSAFKEFILLGFSIFLFSVSGILGDLFESSWKRYHQTKNSGSCLPGLGGIYDLTDSIIMSAPIVYFVVKHFLL